MLEASLFRPRFRHPKLPLRHRNVDFWRLLFCSFFGYFGRYFGMVLMHCNTVPSIFRGHFFARFSEKRLAWIRTHARLRRCFYGLQAVVTTTPPTPRLRVKGVRFKVICKPLVDFGRYFGRVLMHCNTVTSTFRAHFLVVPAKPTEPSQRRCSSSNPVAQNE